MLLAFNVVACFQLLSTCCTPTYNECDNGPAQCLGGPLFECGPGYRDALCHSCARGHFAALGTCAKCVDDERTQWIETILITTFIFAVWFGMNRFVAGRLNSFDMLLHFCQVSDIVGNFSLKWSGFIERWQAASALLNFNVDVVASWQCHTDWGYDQSLNLTFLFPWLNAGFSFGQYLYLKAKFHLVR